MRAVALFLFCVSPIQLGWAIRVLYPDSVHVFYYLWYGNPEFDNAYRHWNHQVLPHWDAESAKKYPHGQKFDPPANVHSPFYPWRGPYSSKSPRTIKQHFEELKHAGCHILVLSWWGPVWRKDTHDTQGVHTDEALPMVFRTAEQVPGIKLAFHLEPYPGRTAKTVRQDIAYLMQKYANYSSLARVDGRPIYYVYDSYQVSPEEWAGLLESEGAHTVRGTDLDGIFLGLWVDSDDGEKHILPAGFDGFYTYFANDAQSYGSNPDNWPKLAGWAAAHGRLFVASVSPGYNDSKIRPWNTEAQRSRDGGLRYERYWQQAVVSGAHVVSITSYNEWGEGTQIEPARPHLDPHSHVAYEDYGNGSSDSHKYMRITRAWTQVLKSKDLQDVPGQHIDDDVAAEVTKRLAGLRKRVGGGMPVPLPSRRAAAAAAAAAAQKEAGDQVAGDGGGKHDGEDSLASQQEL